MIDVLNLHVLHFIVQIFFQHIYVLSTHRYYTTLYTNILC